MTPTAAEVRNACRWRRGDHLGLIVLLAVWTAVLADDRAHRPVADDRAGLAETVRERIDPNTAPAASLRRLVGIGPGRAEAIVRYRRAPGAAPFTSPDDLQHVPGLGAVTVERIRRHLSLPQGPGGGPGDRR